MGKRTSYPPGTFSWVDLATTDAAAAKAFYAGLFGWEMEDEETDGAIYTLCRLDTHAGTGGDAICGLFEMSPEMLAAGLPTNWTNYVTVEDADATAARVSELGGEVMRPPFDVMDIGRMAIFKDARGAAFAVWQPRARIGAERVNDVGCLCLNDLNTQDVDAACSFYERLFGWRTEMVQDDPDSIQVAVAYNGDSINASIFRGREGVPEHWRPRFTVEDVNATLQLVQQQGGQAVAGPLEIFAGGVIGVARDPQGALFGLFAGEVDP